ncbi:zinc-dependent alcohol dehydrogenase family protein [Caballeronia sp. SEWSISQ10-4 2]|uniref:zinc-dependent alcohol dehydrogenase family protein n=1 Tax=Caballeronia sp. SEWSISQ10-4 2 TaxID=2937438 RepID=UPI002655D777|nr:zinc-dependent alcohol dehydrogenase family protein [Caballeronia sp. SEWSISQ10-4 2]MDN7179232.1 zinc-dependent alcohol dehydrogenase family protein [Caballeronia sp. SEWSISQ10-4 2]
MIRSVRIHEFGNADVLQIESVATAQPGAGEVRLRIHAIGLNRTELTLRSGRSPVKPTLPSGLGFEAAGVIEELGPDVSGFAVGDRVALVPAYGAAEYALYGEVSLAPSRSLVAVQDGVSFVEAAATWAAFGTAWAGLIAIGNLAAGQTVLISAASSSVGLAAIQIANRVGARPVALTRSRAKIDELLGHGAAAAISTDEQDVVAEVKRLTDGRGADLVFDPVGGPGFAHLARATANGGTLILYGALATDPTVVPPFDILARDLTIRGLALPARTRDDAQLTALKRFVGEGIADGTLRPTIARTFVFDEIAAAHRFIEAGEQVGKVVVTV